MPDDGSAVGALLIAKFLLGRTLPKGRGIHFGQLGQRTCWHFLLGIFIAHL
jgi:hypothetical protein